VYGHHFVTELLASLRDIGLVSYPAYYGRPALVSGYRRATAPGSVHVVALIQYVVGLLTLLAATGVVLLIYGRGRVLDEQRVRIPETLRRRIEEGQAGLVMAIGMTVIALMWLIIARSLQRGGQWARITVLMLSVLGIAGVGWNVWHYRSATIAAGAALPLLYLLLLNTRAARSWFRWGSW
jgi:hypothetical protein